MSAWLSAPRPCPPDSVPRAYVRLTQWPGAMSAWLSAPGPCPPESAPRGHVRLNQRPGAMSAWLSASYYILYIINYILYIIYYILYIIYYISYIIYYILYIIYHILYIIYYIIMCKWKVSLCNQLTEGEADIECCHWLGDEEERENLWPAAKKKTNPDWVKIRGWCKWLEPLHSDWVTTKPTDIDWLTYKLTCFFIGPLMDLNPLNGSRANSNIPVIGQVHIPWAIISEL